MTVDRRLSRDLLARDVPPNLGMRSIGRRRRDNDFSSAVRILVLRQHALVRWVLEQHSHVRHKHGNDEASSGEKVLLNAPKASLDVLDGQQMAKVVGRENDEPESALKVKRSHVPLYPLDSEIAPVCLPPGLREHGFGPVQADDVHPPSASGIEILPVPHPSSSTDPPAAWACSTQKATSGVPKSLSSCRPSR